MPDKPIRVLFITVDPARDTPAMMADYVSSFDPRIIGLSGSPRRSPRSRRPIASMRARGRRRANGDYSMDHSSVVYLMDANGAFVEALNLERPPEETAKELAAYF